MVICGMYKKRVVVVGGGTGTHTVLRGLRESESILDISAVVSMADSGGSTGLLRDEFGYLPIGDVRNALTALAANGDTQETLLRQLFLYRFDKGVGLSGHNFGNLFLTALTDILGSEVLAIKATSEILKVAGRVIPVTTDNVELVAGYDDGTVVVGEYGIDEALFAKPSSRIISLTLTPVAKLHCEAREAIVGADLLVLGPGDLYTSILANCVVNGFSQAVMNTKAKIVYVCNLMSKRGQTTGMHAMEHIAEITKYIGRSPDVVLVNTDLFQKELIAKYQAEGEHPVLNNCVDNLYQIKALPFVAKEEVRLQSGDIMKRSLIRHDSNILAKTLINLL